MKYFFVDTETTGTDPKRHGVTQIGVIIEIDGKIRETLRFKVKPFETDEIEQTAIDIQNTSLETIKSYPSPQIVHQQLISIMERYVDRYDKEDKFHLIGYNARFDSDMLREWFNKCGDVYYGSWFFFPPIDVMNIAAVILMEKRARMDNFKLQSVCEEMGLFLVESFLHNALEDVKITRDLFYVCKKGLGNR